MNDSEFHALAETQLRQIETALEACEGPFDFDTVADGALAISFPDQSQILVNRHDAAREMWVAAKAGGFHYRWNGHHWLDTRSGREIMDALSAFISQQSGEPVSLV